MNNNIKNIKENFQQFEEVKNILEEYIKPINKIDNFLGISSIIIPMLPMLFSPIFFINQPNIKDIMGLVFTILGLAGFGIFIYQIFSDYKLFKFLPFFSKKRIEYIQARKNTIKEINQKKLLIVTFFNEIKDNPIINNNSDYIRMIHYMNTVIDNDDEFNASIIYWLNQIEVSSITHCLQKEALKLIINKDIIESSYYKEINESLIKQYL